MASQPGRGAGQPSYDFAPGATITPYVGAGAGIAFTILRCRPAAHGSTQFAYQGIVGVAWNIDQSFRVSLDGALRHDERRHDLHQTTTSA